MPTRFEHLRALRQQLTHVISAGAEAQAQAQGRAIGLHGEVCGDLHWLQQSVDRTTIASGCALTLGFDDDCAGHRLPRTLLSPLDGSSIPVRSIRGGFAGRSHAAWVQVRNVSHPSTPPSFGTLGAILRHRDDPRRLFALTAGHVLAASATTRAQDEVSLDDGNTPMHGRLFDWAPNFGRAQPESSIDAALVQIDASELRELNRQQDEWPRGAVDPFGDHRLQLRTQGQIFHGHSQQYMSCRLSVGRIQPIVYTIKDALCWSATPGFRGGDSGAPIWSSNDELVGIHAGSAPDGADRNAVAIPIGRILRWANARVVCRGEELIRPPVPVSSETMSGSAIDAPTPEPADELSALAKTMWGEARGEGAEGMSAVAHVVLNRVARQTYWGKTVAAVCLRPYQFSCWNTDDPNRSQLLKLTSANGIYSLALQLAQQLRDLDPTERARQDTTSGATHYHARTITPPRWARGRTPCARIRNHLFYRDIA
ncbi:cell wall hydrolase [Peristeroidobacter soli]|uniref:cell wall hydrolase n=1 Tax=Peristeroidobacter soli TaxID=2497877 RepID=UPI001C3796CD|nr:cell wall hydrolase [Peristeroidobacter soli]